MKIIIFLLNMCIIFSPLSYGQDAINEGRYYYQSSEKSDLSNGTILEIKKNNIIYLNTNFGFTGKITYLGKWRFQKKYLHIYDLKDTSGIEPSLRYLDFDTIAIKNNSYTQICINDEANFTTLFPAKISINDKFNYFLKRGDTISILHNHIKKIEVTVEGYTEYLKVSITKPVLINLFVHNKNPGTLHYYFKDFKLRIKKGKLYYNNVALLKL